MHACGSAAGLKLDVGLVHLEELAGVAGAHGLGSYKLLVAYACRVHSTHGLQPYD